MADEERDTSDYYVRTTSGWDGTSALLLGIAIFLSAAAVFVGISIVFGLSAYMSHH